MVPTAVVAGRKRAERHVRRRERRGRLEWKDRKGRPRRRRIRFATGNLIAHQIAFLLFLRLRRFWGKGR